jgi:hypothetical protein
MSKRVLHFAILAAAAMATNDNQRSMFINNTRSLHEQNNNRNLQGMMSRHKAKMKCKKYCR